MVCLHKLHIYPRQPTLSHNHTTMHSAIHNLHPVNLSTPCLTYAYPVEYEIAWARATCTGGVCLSAASALAARDAGEEREAGSPLPAARSRNCCQRLIAALIASFA